MRGACEQICAVESFPQAKIAFTQIVLRSYLLEERLTLLPRILEALLPLLKRVRYIELTILPQSRGIIVKEEAV